MRNRILAYAIKYHGDWTKIAQAIKEDEPWQQMTSEHSFVTIVDEQYPDKLKDLRFPPWILFYEGDLSLLNRPSLAIVGSRDLCAYASTVIERLIKANKTRVVISGLAKGVDAKAHWCAFDNKTVGILGCGLDVVYPKENKVLIEKMKQH